MSYGTGLYIGFARPGRTLYFPFATYHHETDGSITASDLAVADIQIYKDGSMTQRASTSGYALLDTDGIDLDSMTGIHGISIDLSDNTTANFFQSGSRYFVVIGPITVDAVTVNVIAGQFHIGYMEAICNATIATLASQTSFTLSKGSADNNAYVGCTVVIDKMGSSYSSCTGVITGYVGATKTVTLGYDPAIFTIAQYDNISILPPSNSHWVGGGHVPAGVLPDAASNAAGGLPISTAGSLDMDALATKVASILLDVESDSYIDTAKTPWEEVTHKKGDVATVYFKKKLLDSAGGNVTAVSTVIGQKVHTT
jgi:hypothetical protein